MVKEPSSPPNRDSVAVDLPQELRRQFGALRSRLRRVEAGVALVSGAAALAVSWLAVFVMDRFFDSPAWVRGGALLLGLTVATAAGAVWMQRWILSPPDTRALAVRVQKKFRRLGDRLLGIVELADESRRPAHFSTELYRAAIRQVATEAGRYDFTQAVETGRLRQGAAILATVGVVAVGLVFFSPAACVNALSRWAFFGAEIPRYTLIGLDGIPAELVVAHGEAFTVQASVTYHSFWRPSRARVRPPGQRWMKSPVQDRQLTVSVPGQTADGQLWLRLGDARARLTIRPLHRPALKELTASIHYPDYLQRPPDREAVRGGALTLLEGGTVTFTGDLTRALASATVRSQAGGEQALKVEGAAFESGPFAPDDSVEFQWRDTAGLSGPAPWRLKLETRVDQAPFAEFREVPREISVLESEVISLPARASDDFGVKETGVRWARDGDWENTTNQPPVFQARARDANQAELVENFSFSPKLLGVAPDSTLELKVYALDYFPGRAPSESGVYRVHVMGNERHAEMLRLQLESIQARLEEVSRLQEKIAAGTEALGEFSPGELAGDQHTAPIEGLKNEQGTAARAVEELARAGAQTLREALRNPLLPEELLSEWTKNLRQMDDVSRGQMRDAQQSLDQARQNPGRRPDELARALEKEKEALEMLTQMQQNVNKGLDQLEALTLAQRLRKIGSGEKTLAARLQRHIGDTIGLLPVELPDRLRKVNTAVADGQAELQAEAAALQGEISRFFERTQKSEYGRVNSEMKETNAAEELFKLGGVVRENMGMQAMQQLAAWSDRFAGWADVLEPKSEGGSGGGEGGSQPSGNEEMAERLLKTLLGFLRLREDEVTLREQTRLLDQRKDEGPIYFFHTDRLVEEERSSILSLDRVQRLNPLAMLTPVIGETFDSMKSVIDLLGKPETGEPTRATQTETIHLLTDGINLINEQARRQQNEGTGGSAAQEIAFLMQMMSQSPGNTPGRQPGQNPGGNQAGGSTDRAATTSLGETAGKAGTERDVQKASGFGGQLPAEFREVLQNYFNALEKAGE